jgi:hypothetical protein
MPLDPGDAHPNGPCAGEILAERLGLDAQQFDIVLARGLPRQDDGRFDPFAAVSWLSWHALDTCPVLARKWRTWLRWFTTPGRALRLSVTRSQSVYLPEARPLSWLVPEPPDALGQRILGRIWEEGDAVGPQRRITRQQPQLVHRWQAVDDLELFPVVVEPRDRRWCETLVSDLAAAFTYQYRRHQPGEPTWTGTCLDLALLTGAELTRRCRAWRLVCGVVAHRALANVHFWIEMDDGPAGWIPLDPTIPAVARMLGPDWQTAVSPAVGRHDARRIRVGSAGQDAGFGPCVGVVESAGEDASFCTDWAIGECSWSVAAI